MKSNTKLGFSEFFSIANYSVGQKGNKFRAYGYEWHSEQDASREFAHHEVCGRGDSAEEAITRMIAAAIDAGENNEGGCAGLSPSEGRTLERKLLDSLGEMTDCGMDLREARENWLGSAEGGSVELCGSVGPVSTSVWTRVENDDLRESHDDEVAEKIECAIAREFWNKMPAWAQKKWTENQVRLRVDSSDALRAGRVRLAHREGKNLVHVATGKIYVPAGEWKTESFAHCNRTINGRCGINLLAEDGSMVSVGYGEKFSSSEFDAAPIAAEATV